MSERNPRLKHAKTGKFHAKEFTQRSCRFRDESASPPLGSSSLFYLTKRVRRCRSLYPLSLSGSTVLIWFHCPYLVPHSSCVSKDQIYTGTHSQLYSLTTSLHNISSASTHYCVHFECDRVYCSADFIGSVDGI